MDFGHGVNDILKDPGACGNNLVEADLNEIIGNGVVKRLQNKYNVDVRIAPRGTLNVRTNYANSINADYFLSTHVNSAINTSAIGFESFIHNNASQKSLEIQNILHKEIMEYMKQYNVFDRGKKRANFAVLRQTKMPSSLIECLFISSPNDAKLLKDNKFLDGLSNAICYGLVLALNLKTKNIEVNKEETIEVDKDIQNNNNINILNTKNSVNILFDEQKIDIDNYIIDDHIYVPLKDICNTFQKEYKWNGENREINIIK